MANYNNQISRSEAQALIPEQVSYELLKGLENKSAAFTLFPRVPMGTNQTRMPVLSLLPVAYFNTSDTGLRKTSEVNWSNKYINAEEISVIVPIPKKVLDDTSIPIWDSVVPKCQDAIARALDNAIFFNVGKPSTYPNAIYSDAVAAGNYVQRGTNNASAGGLSADISDAFAKIEAEGFYVNGCIARTNYMGYLRNARSSQGVQLMEVNPNLAYGAPIMYPMRGLWPTGSGATSFIAGQFDQGILGVRQDIEYQILTEATLTDDTGAVVYNLPQQGMVALMMVCRFGFVLANTINYDQPIEGQRYPFTVIREA